MQDGRKDPFFQFFQVMQRSLLDPEETMQAVHSEAVSNTVHWYSNPATYGKVCLVALAALLASAAVLAYLQGMGSLGISLLGAEAGMALLSTALLSVSSCAQQPPQSTTKERPVSQRLSQIDTTPAPRTAQEEQQFLFDAVASGREAHVVDMISRGVPVDRPNREGDLPLHRAIKSGQPEVAKLLVYQKVGINQPNRDGLCPLHLAAKFLLSAQDSVEEVVQTLIDYGAQIEARGPSGTALHYAAMHDNVEAITALLANHAEIDATNTNNDTPLNLAVTNSAVNAIRTLLSEGADRFKADSSGHTPFYHSKACYSISAELRKQLSSHQLTV